MKDLDIDLWFYVNIQKPQTFNLGLHQETRVHYVCFSNA